MAGLIIMYIIFTRFYLRISRVVYSFPDAKAGYSLLFILLGGLMLIPVRVG
jgi:hypothetical protein